MRVYKYAFLRFNIGQYLLKIECVALRVRLHKHYKKNYFVSWSMEEEMFAAYFNDATRLQT